MISKYLNALFPFDHQNQGCPDHFRETIQNPLNALEVPDPFAIFPPPALPEILLFAIFARFDADHLEQVSAVGVNIIKSGRDLSLGCLGVENPEIAGNAIEDFCKI